MMNKPPIIWTNVLFFSLTFLAAITLVPWYGIANDGGSVINTSVVTFMEFIDSSSNQFRLLLRERSGTSKAFRAAVAREIKHFILELAHYLESETKCDAMHAYIQSEAMVTLVFNAGAEALDIEGQQLPE